MIIDENTGLPQIEDGKFWRVRPYDEKYPHSQLLVELCTREGKLVPAETKKVLVKKGTFWNFWKDEYETVAVTEETTREEVVVIYSSELKESARFKDGSPEGAGWSKTMYQFGAGVGYAYYERALPVTAESILKVAERLWTREENKRTEGLRIQELVGEYPPNKLEVS